MWSRGQTVKDPMQKGKTTTCRDIKYITLKAKNQLNEMLLFMQIPTLAYISNEQWSNYTNTLSEMENKWKWWSIINKYQSPQVCNLRN